MCTLYGIATAITIYIVRSICNKLYDSRQQIWFIESIQAQRCLENGDWRGYFSLVFVAEYIQNHLSDSGASKVQWLIINRLITCSQFQVSGEHSVLFNVSAIHSRDCREGETMIFNKNCLGSCHRISKYVSEIRIAKCFMFARSSTHNVCLSLYEIVI